MTSLAAVLGHPISHSLSPVLHQSAYDALGLDWRYEHHDVDRDELAGFLATLGEQWRGLSLTMPLKHEIFQHLDFVDPLAEVTGSVNTVMIQRTGARRTLTGANTDVQGIVDALAEAGAVTATTSVVVGAGATASSALAALAQLGDANPTVLVRSLARTAVLRQAAQRMGVTPTFHVLDDAWESILSADVVVSTLPPHAADPIAEHIGKRKIRINGALLDVAYDPRPTALTTAWTTLGGRCVTGERMLLHQAAAQVHLMTGRTAPLDVMDQALSNAL
ncbi:shikimate dehydrogenase [Jonesia denitrificans]|uniref:Shikimate dehydrogenase substrate binding domain protein n=1 Tax=Jonesia denitrificans (strain ATCC 14870 / DSM 20603 / BCRC 15368 / CIP 55.134 / JCM 11481 / NBRC 15587 / NCTC 10816 / Prevot 55134) TaxID=471856 RepID=C7R4E7_JONDD|nr:shikimate dehydrogenase [Jonesia denitrificans]ACV09004.1 Shikimate dehydrogenase substrate binding domain protein [Jonesia denitrificans DSM 20603]ASE09700.1 shikimate dehydrogenase [Jonesia denitrificans]QXB44240.1 shikimate dehydrogenase [Jonesia denitrificans]SQH21110.1 Shikimate dehydrogenase [Jonesia denitrificans]